MLSAACHESLPPPPAEPATAAFSFRRLAVTSEKDDRQKARRKHPAFPSVPTAKVPTYSRIVFRSGTVSVR
jgi:hypothetical protein